MEGSVGSSDWVAVGEELGLEEGVSLGISSLEEGLLVGATREFVLCLSDCLSDLDGCSVAVGFKDVIELGCMVIDGVLLDSADGSLLGITGNIGA